MKNRVLIFAGGTGQRMGNEKPKQFLEVGGKPIIVHTIEKFESCELIDSIVVVCLKDYVEYMQQLINKFSLSKIVSVVEGGNCGQQSIYFGLKELVRLYGENCDDVVLIHDGVRPVIDDKLICDNVECARLNGNSVTVAKSIETVVLLDENSVVDKVMDRKYCNVAKAPQCFLLKDIYACHRRAVEEGKLDFIDSAMLMQHYGHKIFTVLGSGDNIKITTPMDFELFKTILNNRKK